MTKTHSVVIAQDQTILREGLKSILSSHPDLNVVDEAVDGIEAIRCARNHLPDLVLMDVSMPRMTGPDAMKEIKRLNADTKIVVLTAHNTREHIVAALRAGADGYLLKNADRTELLTAIRHVLEGYQYLSPSISGTVVGALLQGNDAPVPRTPWENLTGRERQVLKLVAEGHKNREIADLLYISVKTVEKHRAATNGKLGINNLASLISLAAREGLIQN